MFRIFFKTKKLINLVTGGAGFLGSHLIDNLMNKGEKVICIDNLSNGSKSNVSRWFNNSNFEFIKHDIVNPIELDIEKIWHFACPASPTIYQSDPIKTTITIFEGTNNMLKLAKEKSAKLLLASSSEIYGDPQVHPQKEDYYGYVNNTGIRSCYEEGKRIAESLCYDYLRKYNLKISVARIFNTYGPRVLPNDGRVISSFIFQAIKNQKLKIFGQGKQTRSFCFVDDMIDGLIKLMNTNYTNPINLGSEDELSILELAEIIRKKIDPNLEFSYLPLPLDDPSRRRPNTSRAKKIINWRPNYDLNNGLDKTIKFCRNLIDNEK